MAESVIWGVHVRGVQGDRIAREQNFIGIGWHEIGDLSKIPPNREAFKAKVAPHFVEKTRGYIINAASQLFRFANEMKPGDWIVYRSKFDRQVYVGKIAGEYRFDQSVAFEYPNIRPVRWLTHFSPAAVSQGALHELGSALTLFQLKNYGDEFISALQGKPVTEGDDEIDETVALVAEEIKQTTEDFILKELARHLKGHGLEAFIANLLRTMGYRTVESKRGADEGVDIIAHRDELKLEPPIIKVQVKSSGANIGRPAVQELLGTLSPGEYGLLVTIGGFSAQARDFVKGKSAIRLLDGQGLVELIMEHYEDLEPRYKALIPLKRVYVPQPMAEDAED